MLGLLACDPNVRLVNIFHLVDEPDLAGWQSGLFEVGTGTPVPKLVGRRRAGLDRPDRRRLSGNAAALDARDRHDAEARRLGVEPRSAAGLDNTNICSLV